MLHGVDPLGPDRAVVLDPAVVHDVVRRALAEDLGTGDATTQAVVPADAWASGMIVARQSCAVAGLPAAIEVFAQLDPRVVAVAIVGEGVLLAHGDPVLRLEGPAAPILSGERTALNLLQRLSGVATVTRRYVDAIAGTGTSISDTRKTTPGLRTLEKYAVRMGGGRNHRTGLWDAILIKDNHLVSAGGVKAALAAAARFGAGRPVQVEVDTLDQLAAALEAGVQAVLLDNMSPAMTADAVRIVRAAPTGATCWIESSGGMTLANVRAYAETGVDTISVGALTHSAPAIDFGLDFAPVLPGGAGHAR